MKASIETRGRRPLRVPALRLAIALMAVLPASLVAPAAFAQAPAATGAAYALPSPAELEKLVARIALYPDDLIAIILPASTVPLQVVQAERFLEKRKTNPQLTVDEKWDDPVKSLLNYPEVVKSMSNDLDWTSALGEAVVASPGKVLDAVQAFRRQTQAAGNLKSDSRQTVVVEREIITIVPANPQVIYVPQYNPTTVVVYGGYSSWGYYPTPYPVYYYPYPPGAAFATGLVWGAAISASWHGGYATHYGGNASINVNTVNVNNVNVNKANVNSANLNSATANRASSSNQQLNSDPTAWKSDKQAGQVSGSVGQSASSRAGEAGYAGGGAAGASGATRPSSPPAGGSAFSGSASGRQTQMDSERGAFSRGSMPQGGMGGGGLGGGGGGRRR